MLIAEINALPDISRKVFIYFTKMLYGGVDKYKSLLNIPILRQIKFDFGFDWHSLH